MPKGYRMDPARKLARFRKRFWKKVRKTRGCWPWTGIVRPGKAPYGKLCFFVNGVRIQLAHRAAWFLTTGDLAVGECILHHCDVYRCCRPDHLWKGTQTENVADAASKGRMKGKKGENNHASKLTDATVRRIRSDRKNWKWGEVKSNAKKHGVTTECLRAMLSGRTWSHVK